MIHAQDMQRIAVDAQDLLEAVHGDLSDDKRVNEGDLEVQMRCSRERSKSSKVAGRYRDPQMPHTGSQASGS